MAPIKTGGPAQEPPSKCQSVNREDRIAKYFTTLERNINFMKILALKIKTVIQIAIVEDSWKSAIRCSWNTRKKKTEHLVSYRVKMLISVEEWSDLLQLS